MYLELWVRLLAWIKPASSLSLKKWQQHFASVFFYHCLLLFGIGFYAWTSLFSHYCLWSELNAFTPPIFTLHWELYLYILLYLLPQGLYHKLNTMYNSIKDINPRLFTESLQRVSSTPVMHRKNVRLVTGWHPKLNKSRRCHCTTRLMETPSIRAACSPNPAGPPAAAIKVTQSTALCDGSACFIFHH